MTKTNINEYSNKGLHRAKQWQIILFPFNNAATNLYFAFMPYFTFYAVMYLTGSASTAITGAFVSGGLALAISTFVSVFAPSMRILDGITDIIIGRTMDRTRTKFGKFRPFMIIGNVAMAFTLLFMMIFFMKLPDNLAWARWVIYILGYIMFVFFYSFQTAVTRAGQASLTNDPKQRSQFGLWNTIGMLGSIVLVNVVAGGLLTIESIVPKGSISYVNKLGETVTLTAAAYGPNFYYIMVPLIIILSAIYTTMAVFAIKDKDKPEFWGVSKDKVKTKDYINIIKENKELKWLVISAGFNKLGSTIATSAAVMFLVFGSLMGDYNGLFIPFYAIAFLFMGFFLFWGSKTGGRKGQKRAVTQFSILAFVFYIGVTILLFIYNNENPATHLSLFSMSNGNFKLTINLYTVLFIVFYGCGYGSFNVTDQMTIPMVADLIDYETYRSGKFVPGIVSTLFSFIDKLISSLQVLLLQVFIVYLVPGLNALPGEGTPYMEGMKMAAIITFSLIPMATWLVTMFCMSKYRLSGKKLEEIQAVNAVRKDAVDGGMSIEEAMRTWKTIDQVPSEYVSHKILRIDKKHNWFDNIYEKLFAKNELKVAKESINAIKIPEKYQVSIDK